MKTSESTKEIATALAMAQGEFEPVQMDSVNPFYKSKFASLGAVIQASRPILAKHELAIIQAPVSDDSGRIGVTTRLTHKSGEWYEDTIFVNPGSDGRSPAQTAGISITYLKRYSWSAMLGLYAEEDTDGDIPVSKAPKEISAKSTDNKSTDKVDKIDATSAQLVKFFVEDGTFENVQSAASVLSRFFPKKDTVDNFSQKAALYRSWRDNGAEVEYALENANAGKEVE